MGILKNLIAAFNQFFLVDILFEIGFVLEWFLTKAIWDFARDVIQPELCVLLLGLKVLIANEGITVQKRVDH